MKSVGLPRLPFPQESSLIRQRPLSHGPHRRRPRLLAGQRHRQQLRLGGKAPSKKIGQQIMTCAPPGGLCGAKSKKGLSHGRLDSSCAGASWCMRSTGVYQWAGLGRSSGPITPSADTLVVYGFGKKSSDTTPSPTMRMPAGWPCAYIGSVKPARHVSTLTRPYTSPSSHIPSRLRS